MDISEEIQKIIGLPEGETIEYKAVLPPSKIIAQLISSFANTKGGYIILGVLDSPKIEVKGLSEDFQAIALTHKAIDSLIPKPDVIFQYIEFQNKKLFVIKIEPSKQTITFEGKIYIRKEDRVLLTNPTEFQFKTKGYIRINEISTKLKSYNNKATTSKSKVIDHYLSVLKIIDDLSVLLYPELPAKVTNSSEGKILTRILFSSFVDNFETYLSDLLYEIYLAKPETLKSKQEVTVEEVLNCSDMQDFKNYIAKQKISKLQKGSVKGFVQDNKQIRDLNVLDKSTQDKIDRILQIRHLYSHRNGIIDEKFLQFYTGLTLNSEHQMSIAEICDKFEYLIEIINKIDNAGIIKYNLATID